VPGGGTATTDAPLGDVVPAGNAITAEVFRVDRTGPVLVHTITWSHPFNRATATRTVGGVRYAISLDLVRR
jgi:hypothetical protein